MYYEWRLGLLTVAVSPFIIVTVFIERRNTAGLNDVRDRALQTATKVGIFVSDVSLIGTNSFHISFSSSLLKE